MKRVFSFIISLLFVVILFSSLVACDDSSSSSSVSGASEDSGDSSTANVTYSNYDKSSAGISYTDVTDFSADYTLTINLTDLTVAEGTDSSVSIVSEENYENGLFCDDTIYVYYTDYQICIVQQADKGGSNKFKKALNLILTGTGSKGVYTSFNSSATVQYYLNEVSITSSITPALMNDGKCTVYLNIPSSTSNTLTDGREYGNGYGDYQSEDSTDSDTYTTGTVYTDGIDSKGTLFTKGNMFVYGSGALTINEGYKHGIACSKGYLRILDAPVININSSGRNGIHTANGFIMDNGTLTINGTGNNLDNESKGIVVEGYDEDDTGDKTGFVVIKAGTVTINTVSKGITAKWDSDEDATDGSQYYPDPFVLITGGTINVTTTGTPVDDHTATVTDANGYQETLDDVSLSPEGIEGKANLYILGGTITCETTDDCINVSSTSGTIEIAGGYIYAHSSANDCIDSNGTIKISGGVVVAYTVSNAECAFDCDDNTFAITGGTVIGIGTNNYSKPTASSCNQGVIVLSGSSMGSSGKILAVTDSDDNAVFAYQMPVNGSQNYIGILSSANLTSDNTYSVVYGASATDGSKYNGLYTTLPTISGGTTATSNISFSSTYVYTQSSSSGGGPSKPQML